MIDVAPAANLEAASKRLDDIIDKSLGRDVNVTLNRGVNVRDWRPDASEDVLEIVIKDAKFKNASTDFIKSEADKVKATLNSYSDFRKSAIFVSPKEYLDNCKKELGELQNIAKAKGFELEADFTKLSLLDTDVSQNQKPKFGTQVISGPEVVSIRINIPTDPQNLEGSAEESKKVVAEIEKNKDQMKAAAIAYIERKGALKGKLTDEQKQHLQKHEIDVTTQQQGNWTSVFINLRSPEQIDVRNNPENKAKYKPEDLEKTNMLMQIEDADRRAKLAGRMALFTGEKLNKPASYFADVAGTEDVKKALEKMMKFIEQKSPEHAQRAKDLMGEKFLISNEEWNLPPEKQSLYKQRADVKVKPGSDEMKITMRMPSKQADELLAAIPNMAIALSEAEVAALEAKAAPTPTEQQAIITAAGATPEAAAAGNITVCADPNHAAVSASGAAATPEGAVAGAGGACVDKNNLTPEAINAAVAAAVKEQAAAPVPPVVAAPPVVDTPKGIEVGGQKISNSTITNFLKKQPSPVVGEVCGCSAAVPAYAHSKA